MSPTSLSTQLYPALYGRLAAILSILVILLVAGYSLFTGFITIRYFKETHQRLNREVAAHIAQFSQPFVGTNVNFKATEKIFFDAMVTNPSAEVYLLDATGRILVYHSPPEKIKHHRVNLAPIQQFVRTKGFVFIQGDDPKQDNGKQIFSAAQVVDKGRLQGYVYVVLLGESYGTSLSQLLKSYAVEWGLKTTLFMLVAALAVGFLVFHLLTRDLTKIIQTVLRFRDGDLTARPYLKSTSELAPLANAFNDMADQLTQSLDQLRKSEQLRRDLVANVSHDLRSPMTSIRGYAETLDMDLSLSETQKSHIAAILQSTHRLTKRVNELFELSKLEARERQPEPEPFLLSDLLTEIFTNFHLIAKQKRIAFTCVNCEWPTVCYADVNMVEQVLQNLVENAIRYSPEDGFVLIQLASTDQRLTVAIVNSVLAIPETTRNYILSHQPTNSAEAVERPLTMGLGLAIVTKILKLHGSELHVIMPTEIEIRFSFELAVYQPDKKEIAPSRIN